MSFLNPVFLFALLAVGLPLLIHLLNLRKPQKVAFSTLSFFQELKKTTIKRIRIKRYLLLLLRLLAIACLALVLARPFLPPGLSSAANNQAPSLNAVLLDNSISMSRIGSEGPLFEYAKDIIREIEQTSKEQDRFILQVTNGEAEYASILSHSNLRSKLDELETEKGGNFADSRVASLVEMVRESPYQNKKIFILSDGQRSQFESLNRDENKDIVFTFIDVGEVEVQNTMVEGLETSTNMIGPGIPFQVNARVSNTGEVPAINQFVSLEFEGEPAGQYSVSLEPGESQVFSFEVTPGEPGSSRGKVLIEGDEFAPDNEYFFTIQVPETRRLLWLKEERPAPEDISYTGTLLEVFGANDAQLSYKMVQPEDLASESVSAYDAVILDGVASIPEFSFQLLQQFVQNGKGLIFYPSENGDIRNYNNFLSRFNAGRFAGIQGEYASFESVAKADELLVDHPAFSGLFNRSEDEELRFTIPEVYYYFKFQPGTSGTGFNLLGLNNGDPLVHEKRFGEGSLLISAIGNDPGWSNFPVKALFAPFYYRTLLYAASSDQGGFANYTLGQAFEWTGDIDADNAEIVYEGEGIRPNTKVVSSGIRLSYPAEEWNPGWVTVTDGEKRYTVSVNIPDEESNFSEGTEDGLEEFLGGSLSFVEASGLAGERLQDEIKSSGFGKEIWSWFMLAGLLLLITESLVSIFYKAETVT